MIFYFPINLMCININVYHLVMKKTLQNMFYQYEAGFKNFNFQIFNWSIRYTARRYCKSFKHFTSFGGRWR